MTNHEEVFDAIVATAKKQGMKPSAFARKVGVGAQRFFNWRRRGVPPLQVPSVSKALGGAMLPSQIRPDLPDLFPAPVAEQGVAEAA